tara:strand:- start:5911 stop:6180 length:270 start_codon:yes stop_codon:yes gene_type:complete
MSNYTIFGGAKQKTLKKREERRNLDAELADRTIFYCTKCKICFEPSRANWHDNTMYYENFVSYGKPRKICDRCKPDKSAKKQNDNVSIG